MKPFRVRCRNLLSCSNFRLCLSLIGHLVYLAWAFKSRRIALERVSPVRYGRANREQVLFQRLTGDRWELFLGMGYTPGVYLRSARCSRFGTA